MALRRAVLMTVVLVGNNAVMEINPYKPPTEASETQRDGISDRRIDGQVYVDGDCLVLQSGTTLPPQCIYSNEPSQGWRPIRVDLLWARPFRLVLWRKRCVFRAYVSPRRKSVLFWTRVLITLLIMVTLMALLGISAGAMLGIMAGVPFSLVLTQTSLKVIHFEGGWFWVQGCGKPFLSALQQHAHSSSKISSIISRV